MSKINSVLIVGNHTCANRGDCAILRGLIQFLEENFPLLKVTVLSRHPISSSYLLGRKVEIDPLYEINIKNDLSIYKKILNKLLMGFASDRLYFKAKYNIAKSIKYSENEKKFLEILMRHDAVIQVGGSFFVDLYSDKQFDHALISIIENKPIWLVGHSVGPFGRKSFKRKADFVFSKSECLMLRETESLELIEKFSVKTKNVMIGDDTAWLINSNKTDEIKKTKKIAITVRELAPFDMRLGVTQEEYELSIAKICDKLIERGYEIIFVSMCTGLEKYTKDDRIIALKIKDKVKEKNKVFVEMNEINDIEIGLALSSCDLLIGTRLHSAILSMKFGTPAIAIYYEHKSLGIFNKIGYGERSVFIKQLNTVAFWCLVDTILDNIEYEKLNLRNHIDKVSLLAKEHVKNCLEQLSC